ncbi:MAG: bifunctional oligoribonuclease/PAP phosphatase NrnA [Coriobacteriia bacterium]|nr:bifunctional oligoribonuclease/PAP phosphatase NrnA [Coriobacteriia bacterium]
MNDQPSDTAQSEPAEPEVDYLANNQYQPVGAQEVLAILHEAQTVAISGHVNPDGDALGSALALRDLLRAMGKKADVVLSEGCLAPELYDFLPDYTFVDSSSYHETPDLFVAVDVSTIKRLGKVQSLLDKAERTLAIDHHACFEGFTQYYYGDTAAPATASLIWEIIQASTVEPSLNMASYCYVAIMTDTGRFAFRNTDRSTFVDATEMVDIGVNPSEMSQLVYENKSLAALRLEALIIDRVSFSCEGRVAYSYILSNDLSSLGLERDATEQLPTILRSIKGVEVAVLFRDEIDEGVRVNLRSRSSYNVGLLARKFGGGGHAGAAGFTLELPLEEAISHVIDYLIEEHSASDGT